VLKGLGLIAVIIVMEYFEGGSSWRVRDCLVGISFRMLQVGELEESILQAPDFKATDSWTWLEALQLFMGIGHQVEMVVAFKDGMVIMTLQGGPMGAHSHSTGIIFFITM